MSHPVDVMIIGVEKAGTTSVLRYLSEHPDIVTHDAMEFPYYVKDELYAKGYDAIYADYFPECPQSKMLLAKNVGCIYWDEAPSRMKEHNPDMKLIAVLRNPVERAYSAYRYAVQMGRERLGSFEEAIHAEEKRLKTSEDFYKRYNAYLHRGLYAEQLSNVTRYFPLDNIKIILFEELSQNPRICIDEILDFIGLASVEIDVTKRHNETVGGSNYMYSLLNGKLSLILPFVKRILPDSFRTIIHERLLSKCTIKKDISPMRMATRKSLVEYYAHDMEYLETVFGLDLTNWRNS